MKKPKLNDLLHWGDKSNLFKVIGIIDRPSVIIQNTTESICPHCQGKLDKESFAVIPESPLFQEMASPVQTLDES